MSLIYDNTLYLKENGSSSPAHTHHLSHFVSLNHTHTHMHTYIHRPTYSFAFSHSLTYTLNDFMFFLFFNTRSYWNAQKTPHCENSLRKLLVCVWPSLCACIMLMCAYLWIYNPLCHRSFWWAKWVPPREKLTSLLILKENKKQYIRTWYALLSWSLYSWQGRWPRSPSLWTRTSDD